MHYNYKLYISKMKRILTLTLTILCSVVVMAIPAKRNKRVLTLADGTKVEATLIGDEHGHWWVDAQGRAMRVNESVAEYISDSEFLQLKSARKNRSSKSNARRTSRMEARFAKSANGARRVFGLPTTIMGKKKGLVILVNFSNRKFMSSTALQDYNDFFNKEGYDKNGHVGSVRDYFYDQSYGKLEIDFDVVGPVTVSKPYSYYGENGKDGSDKHPGTLVGEAVKLVDEAVNFADYDWDGDGKVDQVFIIYAGTGEARSGVENEIWPHEFSLSGCFEYQDGTGALQYDGVTIDTYAMSNELADSSTPDGIGTAVHEFSHCLGYADLYDTDYSGGPGMLSWDVMDAGSYNGPNFNGEVPAPYTAYERWWAGWMDITELTIPCKIKDMKPITTSPEAYAIYNDANRNEFYVFENHQSDKWSSYSEGHGMLIYHVDYNAAIWQQNLPNDDKNHQRLTFIPADNSYGELYTAGDEVQWYEKADQKAGDLFPGTSNVTSFTDETSPAAILYNENTDGRNYLGKPITDISESADGLISFVFDGGVYVPVPEPSGATNVTENSFTANWSEVNGATYNLEVVETDTTKTETVTFFAEDFSKVEEMKGGVSDVSNELDDYTKEPGWQGYKVYLLSGGVKIGTSKSAGWISTPLVHVPSGGMKSVKLSVESYANDSSECLVYFVNDNGKKLASVKTSPYKSKKQTINCKNIKGNFKLRLSTTAAKKRLNVYSVQFIGYDLYVNNYDFANIDKTSYSVAENVDYSQNTCKYRVQAVVDGYTSKWSDYMEVSAPISTGINSVEANNSEESTIYTISGQRVKSADRPGIYIINGKKVLR